MMSHLRMKCLLMNLGHYNPQKKGKKSTKQSHEAVGEWKTCPNNIYI